MNRRIVRTITLGNLVQLVVLVTAWQALAQAAKVQYPTMAPPDQYLMDRNAEIALAESATPPALSSDANDFTCLLERPKCRNRSGTASTQCWCFPITAAIEENRL